MDIQNFDLSIAITGSITNTEPKYNPYNYLEKKEIMDFIKKVCLNPVPVNEVKPEIVEGLVLIEAVRKESEKYVLNFPCFLKEDIKILLDVSEKYTQSLSNMIIENKNFFMNTIKEFKYKNIDIEKYLFFIIGCASLDWIGGVVLERTERIVVKKRVGDNKYTLFGNEKSNESMKELYWGSHNFYTEKYVLTTFGDHDKPRHSFPDIFFWLFSFNMEKLKKLNYYNEFSSSYDYAIKDWGNSLVNSLINYVSNDKKIINEKNKSNIDLLKKLNYIKDEKLNIPILDVQDTEILKIIINKMVVIINSWLDSFYLEIKKELQNITPIKYNVDYKEVFMQVWHYLFAVTNKNLARKEFFFDPYNKKSDWQGFMPIIYSSELNDIWQGGYLDM